ncbi:hypothetical protein [Candidatus Magnetomonas plexicatena]|uniref:hypothetical protein n=1 Tax=Candidatus Magnetomonas plexicatena TaxID=2552947 RepID=UPI001C792DC9|nr:hypothetical protein E2O03_005835 [Nitrospirales bacterium LBB_01]
MDKLIEAITQHPRTSLTGAVILMTVAALLMGKIDKDTALSVIGVMSAAGLLAAKDGEK